MRLAPARGLTGTTRLHGAGEYWGEKFEADQADTKTHLVTPTPRAAHARRARGDRAAQPRCDAAPPEEQLATRGVCVWTNLSLE